MWDSEGHGVQAGLFIDGQWLASAGDPAQVFDPATGQLLGEVALAGERELTQAVEAAQRAFASWGRKPAWDRGELIRKAGVALRAAREEVARCVVSEQGKPLAEARQEVEFAAQVLEWCAGEACRQYGRTVAPRAPGSRHWVVREPLGVAVLMPTWNVPVLFAARKLGEALAAGCTAVMLGSPQTPGSAVHVLRAFESAGLPAGVANLVFGRFPGAPRSLLAHACVRKLSFTGSMATARQLQGMLHDPAVATTYELGGHAPAIVMDDADVQDAAAQLCAAKFRNAGQVCTSPTRLYVHRAIHDDFIGAFMAQAAGIQLGHGLDTATRMGPLAARRRVAAVQALLDDATGQGARLLQPASCLPAEGAFLKPSLLADVPTGARVLREEPFGPVACVAPFDDVGAVIHAANALPFGLAAYAFTDRPGLQHRLEHGLDVGLLAFNTTQLALPETPFGGAKESGLGSEGGIEGLHGFSRPKTITQHYPH